jgi:lysophospholipid acyltransferase (LPLAT)-like uncharacterized protein
VKKKVKEMKQRSDVIKKISKYALRKNLMIIAYYLLRLYFLTIRIETVNDDYLFQYLKEGEKLIAAVWHQRIISVIRYASRFRNYQPSVMISQSRDGDLAAYIFSRIHFRPIRGSSSRGGGQALAALVDDLKNHPFAVQVMDGPRGPSGVIKPGLIVLAQKSGVPIMPAYISFSRAWVLKSWDRTLIPKPFSKIRLRWGQPIVVPREMDDQTFENERRRIETLMLENQRRDDSRFGWADLI